MLRVQLLRTTPAVVETTLDEAMTVLQDSQWANLSLDGPDEKTCKTKIQSLIGNGLALVMLIVMVASIFFQCGTILKHKDRKIMIEVHRRCNTSPTCEVRDFLRKLISN